MTDTLVLDDDGLYDPAHFNDRLLLGLKGTMSEAELHVLRARLRGGIISKRTPRRTRDAAANWLCLRRRARAPGPRCQRSGERSEPVSNIPADRLRDGDSEGVSRSGAKVSASGLSRTKQRRRCVE